MNFKHKILSDKSYEKKLPRPTHEPIRIDDAKIEDKSAFVCHEVNFPTFFESIFSGISAIVPKTDFTQNVYYQHPDVMNKYREKKFDNPPRCPRCEGNHHINYQADYISHNVDYHGASFSIIIQEIERILQ